MDPSRLHVLGDEDGHKIVQIPTGRIAVPFDLLFEAERAAAAAAKANDPPDELRCKYKSTRCMNPRARKRNGELHNFCQMHRDRANENQRNSEQRKRNSKHQPQPRGRRGSRQHADNQQDPDLAGLHEEKSSFVPLHPHQIPIPEPLQASDSPYPEPTYDELKETALLLSFPDRDRDAVGE